MKRGAAAHGPRQPPYRISTDDRDAGAAHVLLCIDHAPAADAPDAHVHPGLALLSGPARQWWLSDTPVTAQRQGPLTLRGNGRVAMGHVSCDEAALAHDTPGASAALFDGMLAALRTAGYPHLLRTWIVIGDIHRGEGDNERYRQFCVGRARVLRPASAGARYPAATVIGRAAGGMALYFLAATEPGAAVENPRQTSAYHYPRHYGPQSPGFVRALRCPWNDLIVSGTAAIVGHDSTHPGDTAAQATELRRNLDTLLQTAGAGAAAPHHATAYLRRPEDIACLDVLGMQNRLTIVAGAVCRPELMVECEAVYPLDHHISMR